MTDNVTIVIQARTNSSRFPCKALINFLGTPLAILAAKRAGTGGHRVILATSTETTDTPLAELASRHGIHIVRGSLDDVLGRFVLALEGCGDSDIVVRLTADNIVPDGQLIAEVVEDLISRGLDYIATSGLASGLPYGCSVEATRVGLIRRAAAEAGTDYEREHVTPWIRTHYKTGVFDRYVSLERGHFRCTIDRPDDYFALATTFPDTTDPVSVSWREIVASLVPGDNQPMFARPLAEFVLGTAQFGMPYGIVRTNEPDPDQAAQMIRLAITNGVVWLDTARAYGSSEQIIGQALANGWVGRGCVATKLSPLSEIPDDGDPRLAAALAENSLRASCMSLGMSRLDTVLVHRVSHLTAWGGRVLDVLRHWRADGLLNVVGVSVQSPQELEIALATEDIGHIQLPFNVLDYRWVDAIEALRDTRSLRSVTVHARSAFLQGLLLSDDTSAWSRARVRDVTPIRAWLHNQANALGYTDLAAFCLGYVRSQDWIDGVVVGCDNLDQLRQNLSWFMQPKMTQEQILAIEQSRPVLEKCTLDPSRWMPIQEQVR
ncbi:aldo/keto reductase [Sulfitobacter faviae]|uniref:aldo/keto reductase n=1 Tax=Sulfitobacter faviae TaxID=1775881 RepID=UPI00398CA859